MKIEHRKECRETLIGELKVGDVFSLDVRDDVLFFLVVNTDKSEDLLNELKEEVKDDDVLCVCLSDNCLYLYPKAHPIKRKEDAVLTIR